MNLLPFAQSTLIKRLPLSTPRNPLVKKLLYLNTALFAYYTLATGPRKLDIRRRFTATPESNFESLVYFHFAHTSLTQYLFTSGVIYTLGNYHVSKYGSSSFIRLFALAALGGTALTAAGLLTGTS